MRTYFLVAILTAVALSSTPLKPEEKVLLSAIWPLTVVIFIVGD